MGACIKKESANLWHLPLVCKSIFNFAYKPNAKLVLVYKLSYVEHLKAERQ